MDMVGQDRGVKVEAVDLCFFVFRQSHKVSSLGAGLKMKQGRE